MICGENYSYWSCAGQSRVWIKEKRNQKPVSRLKYLPANQKIM